MRAASSFRLFSMDVLRRASRRSASPPSTCLPPSLPTSVTNPNGRFGRAGNPSGADAALWPYQGSANSRLMTNAVALRNAARGAKTLGTDEKAMTVQ